MSDTVTDGNSGELIADTIQSIDHDCPSPFVPLPVLTRLPSAGAALKKGKEGQKKTKEKPTKRVEKNVRISSFKASDVTN